MRNNSGKTSTQTFDHHTHIHTFTNKHLTEQTNHRNRKTNYYEEVLSWIANSCCSWRELQHVWILESAKSEDNKKNEYILDHHFSRHNFLAHDILAVLTPIFDSIRKRDYQDSSLRPKTSRGWALSFLQTRVTLSEHGCVAFPFSTRVGGSVCGPPRLILTHKII